MQKFYVLPAQCIDVFYMDLRTNSALCSIHQRIGFCNGEGEFLLRGTNWILNKRDWVSFFKA